MANIQQESQFGIYTISPMDEKHGHDNLGASIPELTIVTDDSSVLGTKTPQPLVRPAEPPMTRLSCFQTMGKKIAFGIDVTIMILVLALLIIIEFGIFPHIKRGFFCDDRSIGFKFQGDTITPTILLLAAIPIPFLLFWLFEAMFYTPTSLKASRNKEVIIMAYHWFKHYFVGLVLSLLVVECLKLIFGELRPHFLDTCLPDTYINCTGSEYITDWTCTSTGFSNYFISDSSKSFPSGHSSIAFFGAVFMIWYMQVRIPKLRSTFLIPTAQCMCLVWAFLCGLSRITDHRHHWWDVLTGMIIGIVFALLTCIFLCHNFEHRPKSLPTVNMNGSAGNHTSVRRLLSNSSVRDEVTMNHVANA